MNTDKNKLQKNEIKQLTHKNIEAELELTQNKIFELNKLGKKLDEEIGKSLTQKELEENTKLGEELDREIENIKKQINYK